MKNCMSFLTVGMWHLIRQRLLSVLQSRIIPLIKSVHMLLTTPQHCYFSTAQPEVHSAERIYLRQRCFDASKPCVTASTGPNISTCTGCFEPQKHALLLRRDPNTSTCMGFSRRNKIPRCHVAVHTLWEKGIRFWHLDYDPDQAQKLISSSMSRHLSTRNISSKSMHAFLSNLAHRQTDKRTRACGQKHIPPPLSDVNKQVPVIYPEGNCTVAA